MKNPISRSLFNYWDSLRGLRAAPERADIEPGEIRHLLADMFILEVAGPSAEFRLAGTRLCALFGRELTGTRFPTIWGDDDQDAFGLVDVVAQDATGIVAGLLGTSSARHELPLELLLLPLRHRGRSSVRMLGALSADVPPVWIGVRPLIGLRTTSVRVLRPSALAVPEAVSQHQAALERRRRLVVLDGGLAL